MPVIHLQKINTIRISGLTNTLNTVHQIMRIYPQQKQPWNNLKVSAGSLVSAI